MNIDILTIVLIVLGAAGIWLLIELVLTVRKLRPAIDQIQTTVKNLDPVIANVDQTVTELQSTIQQATPLLEETTGAIGSLDDGLQQLDSILSDISMISGKAGVATVAVSEAAGGIASKAKSFLSRGKSGSKPKAMPAAGNTTPQSTYKGNNKGFVVITTNDEPVQGQVVPEVVEQDAGYFTYPAEPPLEMHTEDTTSQKA